MHIYNRTALAQATADFIRQRANWEFYVSLSYVNEVRAPLAARHFQRFLRSVAKRYGTHVDVAWGEEEQERGAYHHHALLAQRRIESRFETPKVTTHDLDTLWRFTHSSTGHARVVRYKPWRGAAYYMARHQNWDINVACPRRPACRRTRCIVAPSAW